MADLLVRHLKLKADEHSALRSLYSQWDFDEKLIPKALQNIGSLFPHYSRHDESHSRQILVNIERLLGKNLGLLSATDTWLLLESAYWHDVGMVVHNDDMRHALEDPEFQRFVKSIRAQPHHELYRFAQTFNLKEHNHGIFDAESPLEALTKFRELMAEWFRRKHPERAERIVISPSGSLGINSPRTELIPARLFRLLGRICLMHGASFKELVSKEGLPFREAGLAQDDCHPRFVACLLRMGDLLDLDDNRFCPVMQRIAGTGRPILSQAHEDKHAAIRHLRIDEDRIEISAECETIDGYLETFRWFDWLKQETQNQMANWRDIAPNRDLGLLPMLGQLTVRLGGNLQVLKDGERPAFTIDSEKAVELLQGNNLYDSKFACIRELLQNSVDATLLNLWLTNKHSNPDTWNSPNSIEIQELLRSLPITVELIESEQACPEDEGKSAWTLTIQDNGTGISRNDLEYMLRIGGSQKNAERQKEINKMPEWMKPSGAFGIGLQSVFMLCDEISIRTKSIFSNEIYDITLYSPIGPKSGLVVLRKLNQDISTPYGTKVQLKFKLDKFAKKWTLKIGDQASIASKMVTDLDPILDDRFPYEAALIADQISNFRENSLIQINGVLKTVAKEILISDSVPANEQSANDDSWEYLASPEASVRLKFRPNRWTPDPVSLSAYYRGQPFSTNNLLFPFVNIEIDLMSGNAGAWLNFSRDKVSTNGYQSLKKTILTSLEKAVRSDLASVGVSQHPRLVDRASYSLFLEGMALIYGGDWKLLAKKLDGDWLDLASGVDQPTFRDFFNRKDWTICIGDPNIKDTPAYCDLEIHSPHPDLMLTIIINEWRRTKERNVQAISVNQVANDKARTKQKKSKNVQQQLKPEKQKPHIKLGYRLFKGSQSDYDQAGLAAALMKACTTYLSNQRYVIPVLTDYHELSLNENEIYARSLFPHMSRINNFVLLPFLFRGTKNPSGALVEATDEQIDRLAQWTRKHQSNPKSLDRIKQRYRDLSNYIDIEIMDKSEYRDDWRAARGNKK